MIIASIAGGSLYISGNALFGDKDAIIQQEQGNVSTLFVGD
jgi:hypothetical protein